VCCGFLVGSKRKALPSGRDIQPLLCRALLQGPAYSGAALQHARREEDMVLIMRPVSINYACHMTVTCHTDSLSPACMASSHPAWLLAALPESKAAHLQ
jgi:hypothetical protein